jgi:hypothetical protein
MATNTFEVEEDVAATAELASNPLAEGQLGAPIAKATSRTNAQKQPAASQRRRHHHWPEVRKTLKAVVQVTCLVGGNAAVNKNGRAREWLSSVTKCGDGQVTKDARHDPARERARRQLKELTLEELTTRAKAEGLTSQRDGLRRHGIHTLYKMLASTHPEKAASYEQYLETKPERDKTTGWLYSSRGKLHLGAHGFANKADAAKGAWFTGFFTLDLNHLTYYPSKDLALQHPESFKGRVSVHNIRVDGVSPTDDEDTFTITTHDQKTYVITTHTDSAPPTRSLASRALSSRRSQTADTSADKCTAWRQHLSQMLTYAHRTYLRRILCLFSRQSFLSELGPLWLLPANQQTCSSEQGRTRCAPSSFRPALPPRTGTKRRS